MQQQNNNNQNNTMPEWQQAYKNMHSYCCYCRKFITFRKIILLIYIKISTLEEHREREA